MNVDATWLVVTKVFAVVMTITAIAMAGGIVFLVWKLSRTIDAVVRRVDPILKQAEGIAETISRSTHLVAERAQRASAQAEEKIGKATADLESAAESIRKAAAGPAGSVTAVLTGLAKGLKAAAGEPAKPVSRTPGDLDDVG